MPRMDLVLLPSSNLSWVLDNDELMAHAWVDEHVNVVANVDDQSDDLGTAIVEYCVNLWVELEVEVGCQRLKS